MNNYEQLEAALRACGIEYTAHVWYRTDHYASDAPGFPLEAKYELKTTHGAAYWFDKAYQYLGVVTEEDHAEWRQWHERIS